jgi:N-acetylmuramoyl-L-alanine amidase
MSRPTPGRVISRRQRLARTATVAVLALLFMTATVAILAQGKGPAAALSTTRVNAVATPPRVAATPTALDPAVFSPGSCVAFPPTSGDRHQTVFLDPGHGGPDTGGQGVTEAGRVIYERDLTLPVVLDATTLLRAQGFRVVDSRTTSSAVIRLRPSDLSGALFSLAGKHRDTAARPMCADLAGAAALVSVHFNVGASRLNAGAETVYDAVRPFSSRSKALADLLQATINNALHKVSGWNIPDDGVVTDDLVGNSLTSQGAAYGHLLVLGPASRPYFATPSTMPGALTEPLYLTDPFEGSIASSSAGQHVIAQAIARAVEQFLPPGAG